MSGKKVLMHARCTADARMELENRLASTRKTH
jgi:hypothetical protein